MDICFGGGQVTTHSNTQSMQRNCLFNVLKICESLISYALSLSICCYPELETGY